MPKTMNTKKQHAKELMEILERGPAFYSPYLETGSDGGPEEFDVLVAKRQFHIWCRTWIIPVVKRLIPELRKEK